MLNKSTDLFFYQWQYRKIYAAARKMSAFKEITGCHFLSNNINAILQSSLGYLLIGLMYELGL